MKEEHGNNAMSVLGTSRKLDLLHELHSEEECDKFFLMSKDSEPGENEREF